MKLEAVKLEGRHVWMEPVRPELVDGLWEAGDDPEIWRFIPYPMRGRDDMQKRVTQAIAEFEAGRGLWLATIDRDTGQPIGASGFWSVDTTHRRLEIGSTWLTPSRQRTAANTEAKLLMLRHCFETLGCIRVEFKTDSLNLKSRAALARIGAVEEGIFRNHFIMPDGRYRHSVYFSIIDSEWPAVEQKLVARLST